MTSRHQRLQELFAKACMLPSADRERYLSEACGTDDALQQEVLALLAADTETCLLDQDPKMLRSTGVTDVPRLDDYRLLDAIASGGMGTVYRAHQIRPVQRSVAVKVLRPELSGSFFATRFETERQILARMQHNGIAQLYESGVSIEGHPFFAMELVEGRPITQFCDLHSVPLAARVRLFVTVCEAVHYAHQKGIVHRDLKPANVLAKFEDGRPLAKVIDFGIALSDPGINDSHTILGTPGYVSPERLRGEGDLPATDIWSLGLLLLELVVGDDPAMASAHQDQSQREPASCSKLLQRLGKRGSVRAELRGRTLAGLRRESRRALDWIVARATATEPLDRYASAAELAEDARRYLRDQPIASRPHTLCYRLTGYWRRNRKALLAATVVLVSVGAVTALGMINARDSQRAQDSVHEASRILFERGIDDELARLPGSDPTRIELLRSGLELSELALSRAPNDVALQERVLLARREWAKLQTKLGRLPEAEHALQRALGDDVRGSDPVLRAAAHVHLVSVLRSSGKLVEAGQSLRSLLETFPVSDSDPWRLRATGAAARREQALNARRLGRPAAAYDAAQHALALITTPPEPDQIDWYRWKLIDLHKILGELAAALPETPYSEHFKQALTQLELLRTRHPQPMLDHQLALVLDSWAHADCTRGRYDEIDSKHERALATLEPLLIGFPNRTPYQETWLRLQRRRSLILSARGAEHAADDVRRAAVERAEAWLEANPDRKSLRRALALLRRH